MIVAGLGTATIQRYFDCARSGDHGTSLGMCPDLRTELDSIADCLTAKQAQLRDTQQRMNELVLVG